MGVILDFTTIGTEDIGIEDILYRLGVVYLSIYLSGGRNSAATYVYREASSLAIFGSELAVFTTLCCFIVTYCSRHASHE